MNEQLVRPSHHHVNERVDRQDSQHDSHGLHFEHRHTNGAISVFDGSRGFSDELDRPRIGHEGSATCNINQEQEPDNEGLSNADYVRPRVRVVQEAEKSMDDLEFSEDDTDPASPHTPTNGDKGVVIDTRSPVCVKDAASMFGGMADWKSPKKTQRSKTFEKKKTIDVELEKAQQEIPVVKQQTEAAEEAKTQVIRDLEATNQLIEEINLSLEIAQCDEQQAKQDYELARIRVLEMEQEIADEARKAEEELEAARIKHIAAVSELKSVKEELESLRNEYFSLLNEKEEAVKRAEEALFVSKEAEKNVERLSEELITTKESLELAQVVHLEAEERRTGVAINGEQEALEWDKELKKAEEKIDKLLPEIQVEKDLKSKLNTASDSLARLKSELAGYVKSKNEHEEVKLNVEKVKDEFGSLKATTLSLEIEIEHDKSELINLKKREEIALMAVASVESELERMEEEIGAVQMREKEAKEKMDELPKQLELASQEADEAKSAVESAREAMIQAKVEAEKVRAGAATMERQLLASQREIEASKASERLAMDAVRALQEDESNKNNDNDNDNDNDNEDQQEKVTIPLEEYYELNKRAEEAENQEDTRVAYSTAQVEAAKQFKTKTMSKLEEARLELAKRKETYKMVIEKAEKATEAKLVAEQDLRKWKAENDQQRKAVNNSPRKSIERRFTERFKKVTNASNASSRDQGRSEQAEQTALPRIATTPKEYRKSESSSLRIVESSPVKSGKKKKALTRFFTFFSKKKTSSRTS